MPFDPPSTADIELPVADVLDRVVAALRSERRVVLHAPPGSGKTTLVAPAILEAGLAGDGEIVLLQPRRVAARTVARHMAARMGEVVGETVGYQVRFDRRVGPRTRIRVVTEGILTAQLQRDPGLAGVRAVVLDEFHERSLHADVGLALLKEVQEALRDDLGLVVMSATLDPAPIATYLGGCPVVSTEGRRYPVEISHAVAGRDLGPATPRREVAERTARAVAGLVRSASSPRGVLVFLPGVGEIERTRELLEPEIGGLGWRVALLHGRLSAEEQDAALRPGRRPRVILATNIAETSLTVEGVDAVVDSGLARIVRHDPGLGVDRLELSRVSRASADQRAGRAGRLGPGRAVRLWSELDHRSRPAFEAPEIARVDLARLMLELRAWGVREAADFDFFEAPDAAALARAEELLVLLGAVEGSGGGPTEVGRRLMRLPVHPRVGRLLVEAEREGVLADAAVVAALLEEPRLAAEPAKGRVWASDVVARREALRRAPGRPGARRVRKIADQLVRAFGQAATAGSREASASEEQLCRLLLAGWPDRLCRRRAEGSDELVMAGGRGAVLARESGVRGDALLLALEVDAGRRGAGARSLVRSASRVDPSWLEGHPALAEVDEVRWDDAEGRAVAARVRRFADLVVDERPLPLEGDLRARATALLLEAARADPEAALRPEGRADQLVLRLCALGRWLPDPGLPSERRAWLARALPRLCEGRTSLSQLAGAPLARELLASLDWRARQALDRWAPEHLTVPSGAELGLRYQPDGPPILAGFVQHFYGSAATPTVGPERDPVLLELLSPAGRPVQVTADLASFWSGAWTEVRKEMRARYPKHYWPEAPAEARPGRTTLKRRR